jgi:hypothetical protein
MDKGKVAPSAAFPFARQVRPATGRREPSHGLFVESRNCALKKRQSRGIFGRPLCQWFRGEAMRENEVPSKTDAGRDEIQNRTRKLPMGLRSILLMVDGQRSVGELRGVTAGLRGADDALEQLREMGLITLPMSLAAAAAATIPGAPPAVPTQAHQVPAANQAPDPDGADDGDVSSGYATLSTQMSEAVREHLGLRGYFLQLKIDNCGDVAELLALLPELSSALGHVRDLGFATDVERRLREVAQA